MSDDEGETPVVEQTNEKSDSVYKTEVSTREKEVTKLLNGGKANQALNLCLENPPTQTKSQEIKDSNLAIVLSVLTAIKEKDIEGAVNGLNADEVDVLMKYVYRGLASGDNSGQLLKWHELALKKGGLGAIVRSLTDRKTV
eukprot:TRINITY_DN880_c0_g1_i1.p1 TRINITY_DN880_c0_g1~~TRINITY_DN880_c0_g1_i1.p1  ORF type:complete len:141 (+),score=41.01 TRINITY_DN880_c0_g1_i1:110-532(+)